MRYNYVPECPRCGSKKTGRYIYAFNLAESDKLIAGAMKNGELIRLKQGVDEKDEPNLYCNECDAQWFGDVTIKHMNYQQLETEKKDRDINADFYMQILKRKPENKLKQRKKNFKAKIKKVKELKKYFT